MEIGLENLTNNVVRMGELLISDRESDRSLLFINDFDNFKLGFKLEYDQVGGLDSEIML